MAVRFECTLSYAAVCFLNNFQKEFCFVFVFTFRLYFDSGKFLVINKRFFVYQVVDLKMCMYDRLYQDAILVNNR